MDSNLIKKCELLIEQVSIQTKKIGEIYKQNIFLQKKIANLEQHFGDISEYGDNIKMKSRKKRENGSIHNKKKCDSHETSLTKQLKTNFDEFSMANQVLKPNSSKNQLKKESKRNPKIIQPKVKLSSDRIMKKELTQNKVNLNNYKNTNVNLIKKNIYHQNSKAFKVGYMGEAYVYNQLKEMNIFCKIKWNAESNDTNKPYVFLNNCHKYYIGDNGEHFDVYAEDSSNNKYYFEIKSSNKENKSTRISRAQKQLSLKMKENEYYIIAVVANVLNIPKIDYILFLNNHRYPIRINSDDPSSNLINCIQEIKLSLAENENTSQTKEILIDKSVLIDEGQDLSNFDWMFN